MPSGELAKSRGYGIQRTTHSIIRSPKSIEISSFVPWRRCVDLFPFDEEYLRCLRAGEPAVEEHFADYFGALLTNMLRKRVRFRAQIEEVIQETFLRVLNTLQSEGGLRSPERLGAFVVSV